MKNLTLYIVFILFPLTGLIAQECPDTVKLSIVTNFDGPDLTVDIMVDNYTDIVGFQFGFNYDADLIKLKFVASSVNGFGADNFKDDGRGNIRFFWLGNALGETLPDDTKLITLKFTPNKVSSTGYLEISPKQLPFEFVNKNSEVLCVKSDFKEFTTVGYIVTGKVIFDNNKNCSSDSEEIGLGNWLIELSDNGKKYYRNTSQDGSYSFTLPNGVYTIRVLPRNQYWQICDDVITTVVAGSDIHSLNFLAAEFLECVKIKTDISTKSLKRCADNTYYLVYENQGNIQAQDVKVSVSYDDEFMQFVGSSFPDFTLENDKVTFLIGNVDINIIDTIQILLNLNCNTTIDAQTHCVTAIATPNDPCVIVPDWSGAKLEVHAECDKINELVRFSIANNGIGSMKNTKSYIVTEDDVMRPPKPIKLDLLEAVDLEFPANGGTYRIFATQDDGFPYDSPVATIALEGCGENGNGLFSTGFVTIFEESDRDLFIDTDCQQAIGLNSSNQFTGFPRGYGASHYIEKSTNIEYIIKFNNTTGDTISTVVINNKIPNTLDISTLQIGSSSHPYSYKFNQERDLVVTFNNLTLPDAMTNEDNAQGYIKYKITPTTILSDGDTIKNIARIFYNNNSPTVTNEVFHTIGSNYIISGTEWFATTLDIRFYPNPAAHELIIDIKESDFINGEFEIINQQGLSINKGALSIGKQNIACEQLPKGLYHIKISSANKPLVTAKVIKL